MSDKYLDFDQLIEEKEQKPIIIKVFGKKEQLPASLPALMVLKIIRMHRKGTENVNEETLFEMAEMLFGKERFTAWLNKGLSIEQLEMLIEKTVEMYMRPMKEAQENEGNSAKTP